MAKGPLPLGSEAGDGTHPFLSLCLYLQINISPRKKERRREREKERERKGRKGKKAHFPYFIWADGVKERDKNKSFECHTMREGHCNELTWKLRCVLCGLR